MTEVEIRYSDFKLSHEVLHDAMEAAGVKGWETGDELNAKLLEEFGFTFFFDSEGNVQFLSAENGSRSDEGKLKSFMQSVSGWLEDGSYIEYRETKHGKDYCTYVRDNTVCASYGVVVYPCRPMTAEESRRILNNLSDKIEEIFW